MRAGVFGAGEVAVACALALRANCTAEYARAREVTLFSRDPHTLTRTPTAHESSDASARIFRAFHNVQIPVPTDQFTLAALPTAACVATTGAEPDALAALDELFLCGPLASLTATSPTPSSSDDAAPTAIEAARRFAHGGAAARPHGHDAGPRFVTVFTRGLTEDGETPAQLLQRALGAAGQEGDVPLLVASGPIFSKEWAAQCAPTVSSASAPPGSIPPRPPSRLAQGHSDPARALAPAIDTGLRRFSGTSLCFAVSHPAVMSDQAAEAIRQHLLAVCFPRENVSVLTGEDMAAVLSLVNACALLCAFGGGLVSNAFAGASLSALASYTQHAQRAVQTFVNGVLGRAEGTPLPLEVCSTIAMSCTNFSSREFVLGRKMDFHFRHDDALNAVYGGHSAFDMLQTTDGIHVLLKKHELRNPFLEALLDTFSTLLRASVVGESLVKEGTYEFDRGTNGLLLKRVLEVDEAVLSANEQEFEQARKRLQDTFGPSCVF